MSATASPRPASSAAVGHVGLRSCGEAEPADREHGQRQYPEEEAIGKASSEHAAGDLPVPEKPSKADLDRRVLRTSCLELREEPLAPRGQGLAPASDRRRLRLLWRVVPVSSQSGAVHRLRQRRLIGRQLVHELLPDHSRERTRPSSALRDIFSPGDPKVRASPQPREPTSKDSTSDGELEPRMSSPAVSPSPSEPTRPERAAEPALLRLHGSDRVRRDPCRHRAAHRDLARSRDDHLARRGGLPRVLDRAARADLPAPGHGPRKIDGLCVRPDRRDPALLRVRDPPADRGRRTRAQGEDSGVCRAAPEHGRLGLAQRRRCCPDGR